MGHTMTLATGASPPGARPKLKRSLRELGRPTLEEALTPILVQVEAEGAVLV